MTGIVGVIAHDRLVQVTEAEIDALATSYEALRGSGARHAASAGTFGRLIKIDTNTADRPGIELSAEGWAVATGVVHGAASLLGTELGQLDGQFALVRYTAQTDELVIATDPFGMHPLYTAEREGKTYFSNSALALARCLSAPLDRLGLAVLLCCGSQYGSISNWEGIEHLGPATALTFSAAGCRRSTYWRPEVDEAVVRMGFQQTVDHAIDVLSGTFRQYFAGRPCMWSDLTGGVDTRLLTLLLFHAGVDFTANTVQVPQSLDVRLGRRVARTAGWPWQSYKIPADWAELAPRYVEMALAWADGRLQVLQMAQVLYIHEQQAAACRAHVAGGGGEIFNGYSWSQEFFRAGWTSRVNYTNLVRMQFMKGANLGILADRIAAEAYGYLNQHARSYAHPYADTLNTIQLDVLLATRKVAWDGAFAAASSGFLRSELPFLFKPAFTTALSIHHRYRGVRRLMCAMIERLNPRVAAIPTTSGGPAQTWRLTNLHRAMPYFAQLGQSVVIKISNELIGHPLLAHTHTDDTAVAEGRMAMLRQLALTPDTMLTATFYKRHDLEDLLRRAYMPGFTQGEMLGRIITVEMVARSGPAGVRNIGQ